MQFTINMSLRRGRGPVPEEGRWLKIGLKAWHFCLGQRHTAPEHSNRSFCCV